MNKKSKKKGTNYSFSLGKTCPRCGSVRLARQPVRHGGVLPRIPGVGRQVCLQCGQAFSMYLGIGFLRERRKKKRVETTNTLLARFRGTKPVFTRIEDISTEGIGIFCPQEQQPLLLGGFAIDLYDCREGTSLEGLPIEIVSSNVRVETIAGQAKRTMKIGARFLHLSLTQQKLLANFIRRNQRTDRKTGSPILPQP